MHIARHTQVVCAAHVCAEFEGMVAVELRCVADELKLVLVLVERAVAAVDAQPRTEVDVRNAVAVDKARKETGAERIIIQALDARIRRRILAEVERQHVDFVAEEAEAEVGHQSWRPAIVKTKSHALVAHLRGAAQADQLRAAALTERGRAIAAEICEAVATE